MATGDANKHIIAIEEYCRAITAGEIPACRLTRLAVERHLRDLARVPDDAFPYYFDPAAAARICRFAELMPHVKGDWAKRGELLKLRPWQCFALGVPFGWKRKADHLRRFREIYDEIPRKNGKSIIGAVIGLYMFMADGEHGAEVYSGATTEKQAWEVFGPARLMMKKSPEICDEAGIEVGAKTMFRVADRSKFEPLIGNPGDGSSPHCAIIDEFHEHASAAQYDTMVTGTGARSQPMVVIITTAGTSLAGPCYDKHLEAIKVLEGSIVNDEMFVLIYSIDPKTDDAGDDWFRPEIVAKANPNFGVSVGDQFLLTQQRNAINNASYQNRFRTKHLNVWCSAKNAWMALEKWNACGDPALDISRFERKPCYFVLDLASRLDICAFVQLFRDMVNGQPHYTAFAKFYLPESTIEDEENPNHDAYVRWRNEGRLIQTDGNEIDFDFIGAEVRDMLPRFQVSEVLYDPWRAVHLAQQLQKDGAPMIEYRQTVQMMSLPMKELEGAIIGRRLHHAACPIFTWMMSNVVAQRDAKENIYPRKEKPEYKIDGPVALIMGVGRAMLGGSSIGMDEFLKGMIAA